MGLLLAASFIPESGLWQLQLIMQTVLVIQVSNPLH